VRFHHQRKNEYCKSDKHFEPVLGRTNLTIVCSLCFTQKVYTISYSYLQFRKVHWIRLHWLGNHFTAKNKKIILF